MKKTTLIFLLFFFIGIHAQVKFEKGYIITNDNTRHEVLIKNVDWVNNPDEFNYKTDENSSESKGIPSNIKEFGIYGYSKYVTYTGPIDYSSDDLSNLSAQYAPEFKESTVFLKELTSGDKNLYTYRTKRLVSYFYSDSSSGDIQPLIYKKYNPEGNSSQVATNDTYITQLKDIFKEDPNVQSLIPQTKYNNNSLTKIFAAHNEKISGTSGNNEFQAKKKPVQFNLNIRPGVNFYSALKTDNMLGSKGFPSKTNFRIGLEAELVLPFNKNKWAVMFEPTYSFYTGKKITAPAGDQLYNISMDSYSFINLPIGIRHYMFLNEKSKLFINAQVNVLTLRAGKAKTIDLDYEGYNFDHADLSSSQSLDSFSFGIGYNYNNKYSIEFKYNTKNQLMDDSAAQSADMSYASIILGYNIF